MKLMIKLNSNHFIFSFLVHTLVKNQEINSKIIPFYLHESNLRLSILFKKLILNELTNINIKKI